jgi:nucleotide-binding universal stress UspA family protein
VRAPLTRTDEGLLERSSTARQAADDVLRRTLRACSDAAAGVEIITQALPGRPGPVLAQAAEGAELLVLGDSEAGLVRVSGSVTDYCIRNSPCPIVVVPSGRLLASA